MFKKRKKAKRYWDFGFINSFVELNKEHIQDLSLCLYKGGKECMKVIQDGEVLQNISGYQFMYSKVGDTQYSTDDYPCMKIRYKSGEIDRIACYKDANRVESLSDGHRNLYRN